MFLEVAGRDGRVERCGGRRQAIGSVRGPFASEVSTTAYADTRASPLTKEQNRMIPRFSGIRHVFDTRAKTYLPVCGVPRRETPT